MSEASRQLHVSLVAIPDAVISTLSGIYDVLNGFKMLAKFDGVAPALAASVCNAQVTARDS